VVLGLVLDSFPVTSRGRRVWRRAFIVNGNGWMPGALYFGHTFSCLEFLKGVSVGMLDSTSCHHWTVWIHSRVCESLDSKFSAPSLILSLSGFLDTTRSKIPIAVSRMEQNQFIVS